MAHTPPRIAAPVCSLGEAEQVLAAGADELYCGVMLDEWVDIFGDGDLLSRRQGRPSHLRRREELAELVHLANNAGRSVAIALNARYTRAEEPLVLALADLWETVGGQSVIVTDLGVLLAIRERRPHLKLHLSLLAGLFNAASAAFFARLGISRVVLPRELSIEETGVLIAGFPQMEYEMLVLNQKCQFVDGFCGFYHAARLPSDVPAAFDYEIASGGTMPVIRSHDPDYEGHGCQIAWQTEHGQVRHAWHDDDSAPHCAACWLRSLRRAGVRYFKIAGRGYPTEIVTRSVRFLREAIDISSSDDGAERIAGQLRHLYARTFGGPCDNSRCYYASRNTQETV